MYSESPYNHSSLRDDQNLVTSRLKMMQAEL